MLNERDIPRIQQDLKSLPEPKLKMLSDALDALCFNSGVCIGASAVLEKGARLFTVFEDLGNDIVRLGKLVDAEITRRDEANAAEARARQEEEDDYRRRHPNAPFSNE